MTNSIYTIEKKLYITYTRGNYTLHILERDIYIIYILEK